MPRETAPEPTSGPGCRPWPSPHTPMSVQPPPSAGVRDPVTPEARAGPVTPEPRASGPPSQAQPLLRQEATGEEEGEETGGRGAWGTGTAEQRRRGWGEADEGPDEAGGADATGSGSPADGEGDGRGSWQLLLGWLPRRPPQCRPCAAPLPRSAAHCCHGGTKMAALAYNLGKREINHYFSVRSAKALALVAVLLLAACHLASRRYRGERALPLSGPAGRGRRRRGPERAREAAPRRSTPTRLRPRGAPRAPSDPRGPGGPCGPGPPAARPRAGTWSCTRPALRREAVRGPPRASLRSQRSDPAAWAALFVLARRAALAHLPPLGEVSSACHTLFSRVWVAHFLQIKAPRQGFWGFFVCLLACLKKLGVDRHGQSKQVVNFLKAGLQYGSR